MDEGAADVLFLVGLVAGIALVFPWMASVVATLVTGGRFRVFGGAAALAGVFVLLVVIGLAVLQFAVADLR